MSTKTTKTRPVLDDEMRNALLNKLETFLAGEGMDVLRVPITEATNSPNYQLAIPTLDSEDNESTLLIKVIVPRRNRDTKEEYDPYSENERYKENVERAKRAEEARKKNREKRSAGATTSLGTLIGNEDNKPD